MATIRFSRTIFLLYWNWGFVGTALDIMRKMRAICLGREEIYANGAHSGHVGIFVGRHSDPQDGIGQRDNKYTVHLC
jgi:hypothetical protein